MVKKDSNYGTLLNSLKISQELEYSTNKNLYIYACLYSNVTNLTNVVEYALNANDYNKPSTHISNQVTNRSASSVLDFDVLYLILKPYLIVSTDHILHSVARALINVLNGKSVSSNFTTEVAFMLCGSSNVFKCMDHILISKHDKPQPALIVTLVQNKSSDSILDIVQGVQDDISNIPKYTKVEEIVKDFKVTDEELNLPGGLESSVLGRIGIKRI